MISSFFRDLCQVWFSLARRPAFCGLVVLTLAAGIGVTACIFTFVREMIFPTFGLPHEDRLLWLETSTPETTRSSTSYPDLLDYRGALGDDAELYAWRIFGATVTLEGAESEPLFVWGEAVEPGHFSLFGGPIARGRGFAPGDMGAGAPRVAVLHHRFWQRRFGGVPVIGERIEINGLGYTVVGVTPKGFQSHGMTHDLYTPLGRLDDVLPGQLADRQRAAMTAIVRWRPGTGRDQVAAKLEAAAQALDDEAPLAVGARRPELTPVREGSGAYQSELTILLVTVGLLLLLATANVASLMLARSIDRRRELAIHAAIGAGRGRLARLLLLEGLTLAFLGGVLGLAVADPLSRVLEGYLVGGPVGTGSWAEGSRLFIVDGEIVLLTALLAVGVGLVLSAAPMLHGLRLDLASALRGGSFGGRSGARRWLSGAQITFSVVLLLGAGLLVRSVLRAQDAHPGFETDRLLLATLFMAPAVTQDEAPIDERERQRIYLRSRERLTTLPGVRAVSWMSRAPLSGWLRTAEISEEARPDVEHRIAHLQVGDGFFSALGVPLERGRELEPGDHTAVVINRALAEKLWPGEDPLGRRLRVGGVPHGVVGVVRDFRNKSVLEPPQPQVYTLPQNHRRLTLLVATAGPSSMVVDAVRREIAGLGGGVSLVDLAPFQAQVDYSLQERRLLADTASMVSLLGWLLATTGLFSVMSYAVSRRRREIGVRMAVGATAQNIRRMVLAETAALVAGGTGAGLLLAAGLSRFLASQLFGVGPLDLLTFATVPALLAFTAFLAGLLPAARAARVEPRHALQES